MTHGLFTKVHALYSRKDTSRSLTLVFNTVLSNQCGYPFSQGMTTVRAEKNLETVRK